MTDSNTSRDRRAGPVFGIAWFLMGALCLAGAQANASAPLLDLGASQDVGLGAAASGGGCALEVAAALLAAGRGYEFRVAVTLGEQQAAASVVVRVAAVSPETLG